MTADRRRKASAPSSGAKAAAKTPRKSSAKKSAAKKATTKEAPAKKAPAKKASAQETPAQEGTATGSPAKKAAADKSGSDRPSRRRASAPRAESKPRRAATEVATRAVEQLTGLTGRTAEGVTGVERNDDGWRVTVEVLEVRRIPQTTDVLARYEIDADDNGDLTGYRRAGRYTRGSARED
jgi:hypothetical protein